MKRGPRRAGIPEVLSAALELESRVMRLYVEIGNRFRTNRPVREFWFRMARHEAGHCGALMLLQTVIESGSPRARPGRIWFDQHTVVRLRTLLGAYLREVRGGVSLKRACEMAIDVEGSELEDLVTDLLGVVKEKAWRERAVGMLTHDMGDLRRLVNRVCGDSQLTARARELAQRRRPAGTGRETTRSRPLRRPRRGPGARFR